MVNFSGLSNLTTIELNSTLINDSSQALEQLIEASNTTTQGYFGLGLMIVVFILLVIMIFRDDDDIRMDIARSIMLSSGFTTILGVVMLYINMISSYTHFMWFFVIFLASLGSVYFLKKKNL